MWANLVSGSDMVYRVSKELQMQLQNIQGLRGVSVGTAGAVIDRVPTTVL